MVTKLSTFLTASSSDYTVTPLSINSNTVIGRTTSGAGDLEELSPGTGISLNTGQIINSAPDQTVTLTQGSGMAITGTYPDFTLANAAPDQTVTLTQGSNVTITGTYPDFTIASTDTNTTYTGGTGINLSGTAFNIDNTVTTLAGTQTLSNKTIHGDVNTLTVDGTNEVGFRKVPLNDPTGTYTLQTSDVGKAVTADNTITVPNNTFAGGDVVSIYNSTASDLTVTCSITTAFISGTNIDVASVTLATRGVATILFLSATTCVITGNVS